MAKIINKYTGFHLGSAVAIAGGLICCTAFAINDVGLVMIGLIGTWLNGMRPLQNSSYNLSFLNIFCTFMV
ncbi:hypothetical protein HMPREF9140_02053 [Prevotella micans F0438]|uniref:Uncharacterized protein n=1 Tax=Prevotella micans F0438 TaxID=883158 RepID=H1Q565_9BACT|nr:hypothetical protein HMPREF9140_02053 [Prevotella micans F0438]